MNKIGKYVIEKKLGQGGMGIVYKCTDPETELPSAVKVLPQQMASDAAFLQRFRREILTLRRLHHPNIVRIYDQGEADGSCFYAMEYVDGMSLEALLDRKEKLPPLQALRIVRGCAAALAHSHSQGVVHRDIKPANIMLMEGDQVKLTDFGIAKVLDATRMTATQGVLGTVEYMSPEQSQGRHVDARSDLYSLGVVLYECLTARLPLTGNTPTEIIMKLRTHQIDPPREWAPEIPRSLDALVMRLLTKEPERRVESAQELLRELDRVEHHIKAGITGAGRVADEPILTTAGSGGLWEHRWLFAMGVLVLAMGAWILFRPPAAPADGDNARDNVVGSAPSSPYRSWFLSARRARVRKEYDLSTDLCHLIIKYYPDTSEADLAVKLLADIDRDKLEDAKRLQEQATSTTLP